MENKNKNKNSQAKLVAVYKYILFFSKFQGQALLYILLDELQETFSLYVLHYIYNMLRYYLF